MFSYILYGLAAICLLLSFLKDRGKTKAALMKALKSFENIMPQFLAILIIIGLSLSFLSPETIGIFIGEKSGLLGMAGAALIGSITLVPGFVAFPLAAALLKNGAGYMQIAAFVSTLMMVGVVTLPLEIKTFGKRAAIIRNGAAFVFSIAAALVIGAVMG